MKIDRPIVYVLLEGDVKDKVSTTNYTHVAFYEPLSKETVVIVAVNLVSSKEQGQVEKSVRQFYQKYGKVKTVKYHKDGINIINMVSKN